MKDSYYLKKKLFKLGLKEYRCEKCGLIEWLGQQIPLEIHHIDENNPRHVLTADGKDALMFAPNIPCQFCGWGERNPITGKVPLALHHIDGDCTNNTIGNLQLLCPNCHSLTDNFGSLNKNSKRFHRSKITLTHP